MDGLINLELSVLLVYLAEDLHILPHPHPNPLRVCTIELLVVLPETDLLHSDDNVRTEHEVLHAFNILPVHLQ